MGEFQSLEILLQNEQRIKSLVLFVWDNHWEETFKLRSSRGGFGNNLIDDADTEKQEHIRAAHNYLGHISVHNQSYFIRRNKLVSRPQIKWKFIEKIHREILLQQ